MKFRSRVFVLIITIFVSLAVLISLQLSDLVTIRLTERVKGYGKIVKKRFNIFPDYEIPASPYVRESEHHFTDDDPIPGYPSDTNINSLNKTTVKEVITEAQQMHFRLFNKLIGKYPYVVLTDLATHENKGDSAIGLGEVLLLRRLGKKVIFYCNSDLCGPDAMEKARKKALLYGKEKVAVLCHGGGNVMSYDFHDLIRSYIFEAFSDFKIIVFPQSIWIRNRLTAEKYKPIYAKYPNVTFLVRDKQSLTRAQQHLPKNIHILAPDIAFQIGTFPRSFRPHYDVLWIKRSDVEKVHYSSSNLNKRGMTIMQGDWISWYPSRGNSMERINLASQMGFLFLQRGRVVITDRLHGHIMSTLLHIPHVLLDTKDKKLSAYHNTWTKGLEGHSILTASNLQDALNKAYILLKKFNDTLPKITSIMDIGDAEAD